MPIRFGTTVSLSLSLLMAGAGKPGPSRARLLETVMGYRERAGRRGSRVAEPLARAAQAKANDMAAKRYFTHVSPDG